MRDTGRVGQDVALTDTMEVQGDLAEEDTETAAREEQEINIESSRRPNDPVGTTDQEVISVEQVIRPVEQGMESVEQSEENLRPAQLLSCRAGYIHNQEETGTSQELDGMYIAFIMNNVLMAQVLLVQ